MDALDFLKPKRGFVLTGSYRRYTDDPPQYFEYKNVDYPSKRFGEVINNLIADDNGMVIRTCWDCGWEINGFVVAHDGRMWNVVQVQHDNRNSENLRFLIKNPSEEFILALVGVNNPKELK